MLRPHCTFTIGDTLLALSAATVTEFGRIGELTPVPLSAPSIAGLVNLRGQIVTVLDIRRHFNLDPRGADEPLGIFFRHEEALCCLLVDAVDDIVEIDDDDLEPPPGNVASSVREVLVGVCKQPGRLLMIVDPHRAIVALSSKAVQA